MQMNNHVASLSDMKRLIDNQAARLYNADEVEAIGKAAAKNAIAELVLLGMDGRLHLNLDNGTAQACKQAMNATEVDDMAKDRIKRRVNIGGVVRWVTGNTEQEYADNLIKAMTGEGAAAMQQPRSKHDFAEYATNWFEVFSKPNIELVTAKTYERQLRYHIIPALQDMAVEDVTVADLQRLFNNMDTDEVKKAHSTKQKVKTVLTMIFQHAADEGIITKNPMKSRSLRIKGGASIETPPYSVEQMRYIVEHIAAVQNPTDRMYLALQTLHPFRLEEVLGLRWQDIDLDENTVHICNTVTHPDRNQPVFAERTKTEASNRTIQLVTQIKQYLTPGKPDEFVIGGEQPLSYTQLRKMRKRIQRDIHFDEPITPRRFRTTVLTDLYDQTKDIKRAQAAAGHTTATMTLKHYVKGRGQQSDTAAPIAAIYGLAEAM